MKIYKMMKECVVLCCVVYGIINYISKGRIYTQHIIHNTLYTLLNRLMSIHIIHTLYVGGRYEKTGRYCA